MQLIVSVNKLNKRSSVPASLSEKNIIGTVMKGFRFEGEEVPDVPSPSLGKWYKDRDNSFYWGGGITVEKTTNPQPPKNNFSIPGLPINLPANCSVGADVSHHNGNPDWSAMVKAGISFVYIKISEGVGTPDHQAKENATNAKANGLQVGYYHFCRPDTRSGGSVVNDANSEAAEALRLMAGLPAHELPLVLDLEDQQNWDTPLNKTDYLTWINTFIAKVVADTGISPMIYSRKEYLDRKLPANHGLGNHQLWIANYGQKNCNTVASPTGWDEWAMWQFTESAVIGGNLKLDLSIKR